MSWLVLRPTNDHLEHVVAIFLVFFGGWAGTGGLASGSAQYKGMPRMIAIVEKAADVTIRFMSEHAS
jgi:hypothetical protein